MEPPSDPLLCFAELLPAAYGEKAAKPHHITAAFFVGCAVMATSLVLEKVVANE